LLCCRLITLILVSWHFSQNLINLQFFCPPKVLSHPVSCFWYIFMRNEDCELSVLQHLVNFTKKNSWGLFSILNWPINNSNISWHLHYWIKFHFLMLEIYFSASWAFSICNLQFSLNWQHFNFENRPAFHYSTFLLDYLKALQCCLQSVQCLSVNCELFECVLRPCVLRPYFLLST
jgi:hypothetical protein